MVQFERADELNAAPLFGMLITSWSELGSVAGSPASLLVSVHMPLVVMVSFPPKLSVQPVNVTGGVLVTSAIRPDARVLAVSVTSPIGHVIVMGVLSMVPLIVTAVVLVTVKVVLTGIRLSLGWAKAAGETSAAVAAAAVSVMAIFLVVRNMIRIHSCARLLRCVRQLSPDG